MDAFEQWMNDLWQKNAKERRVSTEEIRVNCSCPACPSYNRCAHEHNESLYCILGKSLFCISEDRGCTCKNCSAIKKLELKYHEFCIKGGEAVQRYEHELH